MSLTQLHLVLNDCYFSEIKSGRKTVEYRDLSKHWISRILKKPLPSRVVFHLGYSDKELMIFRISGINVTETQIAIHLGERLL